MDSFLMKEALKYQEKRICGFLKSYTVQKSHRIRNILAMSATLLFIASSALAATINVTADAPDILDGSDNHCSLREAIFNINNGVTTYADCVPVDTYGTNDTVTIPAGTYTTLISAAAEDNNASGDYDILIHVTILGAGADTTIIDGNSLDRIFHIPGAYSVSISGVTLQNGNSAVYSGSGGAILNAGTLTVANSTIHGNTTFHGGGIRNTGTLVVSGTTIRDNTATRNGGGISNANAATVTNSTISGNTAGWWGGGIVILGPTTTITNSTIIGNSATSGTGGIHNDGTKESVTVSNTIVANQLSGTDCNGNVSSSGYNLESSSSCGFIETSDLQNTVPLLGPLASNGGPTQTYALLVGSPAIDSGDCSGGTVAIDQRGVTRPQGGGCDIGAFELSTTVSAIAGWGGTVNPGSQAVNPGATATFTVTPDPGYFKNSVVGGTCAAGYWNGDEYTTGAVTSDCSVTFSFIYYEDFESFTENSYPTSLTQIYDGTGSANQKVITTTGHDTADTKVFRLEGASSWASEHIRALPALLPPTLVIDAFIKPVSGTWPGRFGLRNPSGSWGTRISAVLFDSNGKITALQNGDDSSKIELGTYTMGTWYRVTLEHNISARTYNVYIDSTQVGTDIPMHPTLDPTQLHLTAGNTGTNEIYYDNVGMYDQSSPPHIITATTVGNGSINPNGAVPVAEGKDQAFDIAPDLNYHVEDVLVDGASAGAVTDYTFFSVTTPHTIEARFAINTYQVTATINGGNGSLDATTPTPVTVNHDATTSFTFNADEGYHVASITGCDISFANTDNIVDTYTATTGAVTAGCNVAAAFAINTYQVTATINGGNGSLDATTPTPVTVNHDATTSFTFNADEGYHVASITGCDISFANTDNIVDTYTATTGAVTAGCNVAAAFAIDTYTLTVESVGKGKGTVGSDIGGIDCPGDCSELYGYNQTIVLTATPESLSKFSGWGGDCSGTDLTCSVTMDQAKNVTARFHYFPWAMFLPAINNSLP